MMPPTHRRMIELNADGRVTTSPACAPASPPTAVAGHDPTDPADTTPWRRQPGGLRADRGDRPGHPTGLGGRAPATPGGPGPSAPSASSTPTAASAPRARPARSCVRGDLGARSATGTGPSSTRRGCATAGSTPPTSAVARPTARSASSGTTTRDDQVGGREHLPGRGGGCLESHPAVRGGRRDRRARPEVGAGRQGRRRAPRRAPTGDGRGAHRALPRPHRVVQEAARRSSSSRRCPRKGLRRRTTTRSTTSSAAAAIPVATRSARDGDP